MLLQPRKPKLYSPWRNKSLAQLNLWSKKAIADHHGVPSSSRKVGKAEVLGAGWDAGVQEVSSQTLHPEVVEIETSVS
jgi:hypothetical protein